MNSTYRVKLDGKFIAETRLERADPPMGVIGGRLNFAISECPYSFFKKYCEIYKIPINHDDEDLGLIDTQNIEGLKIFTTEGIEVAGEPGSSVCGFNDEGYEITIIGVPYPFYEEEFPHHVEAYDKRLSE